MTGIDSYALEVLTEACQRHPLKRTPTLVWKRFRTTAGRADLRNTIIELSSIVLRDEAQVRDTLLHEYAHLMAFERYGMKGRGHGPAWRHAMRELGLEPKVKHTYDCTGNRPRQRVIYRCKGCGATFARLRRLAIRKRFVHRGCGGDIAFVRVEALAEASPDISVR